VFVQSSKAATQNLTESFLIESFFAARELFTRVGQLAMKEARRDNAGFIKAWHYLW
jgi:hypothetical protein